MLGYWLSRSHPRRIGSSPHVLSISTFQRNRSCCELVQGLVDAPTAARAARPKLFLLHTGNLGKLPDSSVAPSMRQLGMALQDQFVPRSDEPCLSTAEDTRLPPRLSAAFGRANPWRARLKALHLVKMAPPLARCRGDGRFPRRHLASQESEGSARASGRRASPGVLAPSTDRRRVTAGCRLRSRSHSGGCPLRSFERHPAPTQLRPRPPPPLLLLAPPPWSLPQQRQGRQGGAIRCCAQRLV